MTTGMITPIKTFEDNRGKISIAEVGYEIPFLIKRLFYIYDVCDGESRGNHANRNSSFFFIALSGSCVVELDNGREKKVYLLDNSHSGLFIERMIWKEMRDFSKDCILLVLSDEHYDANEYIDNYSKFIEELSLA